MRGIAWKWETQHSHCQIWKTLYACRHCWFCPISQDFLVETMFPIQNMYKPFVPIVYNQILTGNMYFETITPTVIGYGYNNEHVQHFILLGEFPQISAWRNILPLLLHGYLSAYRLKNFNVWEFDPLYIYLYLANFYIHIAS